MKRNFFNSFAIDSNGRRINILDAIKRNNSDLFCEICGKRIKLCNGEIKNPYFAHYPNETCYETFNRDLNEKKSKWHLQQQNLFAEEYQEVVIERNGEKHRADVFIRNTVYEFQHSPLKIEEFNKRNEFYLKNDLKVVWCFDYTRENKGYILKELKKKDNSKYKNYWFYTYKNNNKIKKIHYLKNYNPQKQHNLIICFLVNILEKDKITKELRTRRSQYIQVIYNNKQEIGIKMLTKEKFKNLYL